MQVDHIDKNTIRVRIDKAELARRGMGMLDLLGNRQKIQDFFYKILDEVDEDHEFANGDPVSFQVMPNNGGLDLMITKVKPDDARNLRKLMGDSFPKDEQSSTNSDDSKSFFDLDEESTNSNSAPQGPATHNFSNQDDKNNEPTDWRSRKTQAYYFDDLGSLIELADNLKADDIASSLYYLHGQYFLNLAFLDEEYEELKPADAWTIANEFGFKVDSDKMRVVEETGKCLLMQNALGQIRHYFLKAAFFKHLVKYSNLMGEKEEHHQSKMLLKSALTAAGFPAEVEIPLAEGQLRADVLATAKLAFEVQCAPLSQQEFNHRHQLYQKIGVKDIWIVGRRHYLKRRLKRTQLIFFRQNKAWGNYYLEINPQRNRFCLKYNVLEEPVANKLVYQSKSFVLDELGIKDFWRFKPFKKEYSLNIATQRKYLRQQIMQKTKLGLKIGEMLYERKLTLDDLPDKVFATWRNPGERDRVSDFLQK